MTKRVRIENANTADWEVVIKVQRQHIDGHWVDTDEKISNLTYPGQAVELDIWVGKRIIIEEGPLTEHHWTQKVKSV